MPAHSLWIGHSGDRGDARGLRAAGVRAVVDVAVDEVPATGLSREIVYCRFPLTDGPANPRWMVRAAVECAASLVRVRTPTLVCCSAGMSRSPCIAAGALALVNGTSAADELRRVIAGGPCDLSGGFWALVEAAVAEITVRERATGPRPRP